MHIFKIAAHAVVHESEEGRPLTLQLVNGGAHTRILRQEEVYEEHELVLDYVRMHNNSNPEATQAMKHMVQRGWVIFQREGRRTFTVARALDVETL